MRNVIAMPQATQKQMPVRRVGSPDDAWGGERRTAGLERRLHGLKLSHIDDGRDRHLDDLGLGLALARQSLVLNRWRPM